MLCLLLLLPLFWASSCRAASLGGDEGDDGSTAAAEVATEDAGEDGACAAGSETSCGKGGSGGWFADEEFARQFEDPDRCDFERIDGSDMTPKDFYDRFVGSGGKKPVIVTGVDFSEPARLWERSNAVQRWGSRTSTYVENHHVGCLKTSNLSEVFSGWRGKDHMIIDFQHGQNSFVKETDDLTGFTGNLVHQAFLLGTKHVQQTFSMMPSRIGTPFHAHPQTYFVQLHGRKRWFFYPPGKHEVLPEKALGFVLKMVHRPHMVLKELAALAPEHRAQECTTKPGELLYFPHAWTHGTVNIGDGIGIGGQYNPHAAPEKTMAGAYKVYADRPTFYDLKVQEAKDIQKENEVKKFLAPHAEDILRTMPFEDHAVSEAFLAVSSKRIVKFVKSAFKTMDKEQKAGRVTKEQFVREIMSLVEAATKTLMARQVTRDKIATAFRELVEKLHNIWDGDLLTWHMLGTPGIANSADEAYSRVARAVSIALDCSEATPTDSRLQSSIQEYTGELGNIAAFVTSETKQSVFKRDPRLKRYLKQVES